MVALQCLHHMTNVYINYLSLNVQQGSRRADGTAVHVEV